MSDARFPVRMTGRVPVVETPEEIDITNAGQFRAALLGCTARGAAMIVVDMSRTHFCDSAGRAGGRLSPYQPPVARCA